MKRKSDLSQMLTKTLKAKYTTTLQKHEYPSPEVLLLLREIDLIIYTRAVNENKIPIQYLPEAIKPLSLDHPIFTRKDYGKTI